jgi:hypothetical protein
MQQDHRDTFYSPFVAVWAAQYGVLGWTGGGLRGRILIPC